MGAVRVTAADVARVAGVSRSTVSYILNGSNKASFPEATVAKVKDAARMLRYTPHAAARTLRRGESSVVLAALQSTPESTSIASLLDELAAAMATRGMSLVTWTAAPDTDLRTVLRDVTPHVIVELMPLDEDDQSVAQGSGVELVSALPTIRSGEEAIGEGQVAHLAAHGHRRIGLVTVDEPRLNYFAPLRRAAVEASAARHGLAPLETVVLGFPDDTTRDQLAEVLREWTSGPDPVTAIAAYNDQFAALTLSAARHAGLSVPGDLSVIGVDDEPLSAWLEPPLSTVKLDMRSLSAQLAALVDDALNDVESRHEIALDAALVVRQSTGAAREGS